ncbi:MAG: hypothetical protein GXO19_05395 [Epsilonproteobacteria bacterium]|nr:hypothetical protein [Campylobacterota bacterium]NPA57152.1 hypothetical protein [Campylobacterota bacterium]
MIIGKIDYINLLPFYIFLRRNLPSNSARAALNYHKDVPAQINRAFRQGKIEAAVISSIMSRGYKCSNFGIVAYREVLSVLICPGENREDRESNTSNILARILQMEGEVVIGDKALTRRKKGGCKDLAALWFQRYRLPFVFARFCYRKHPKRYKELSDRFLRTPTKIPFYILKRYGRRTGLTPAEIRSYLQLIGYRVGRKEELSLKKFLKLARTLTYSSHPKRGSSSSKGKTPSL